MNILSVDTFFERNGQSVWKSGERDEDMTIKSHRRQNIKEETRSLHVFRQGENWWTPQIKPVFLYPGNGV